MQPAELERQLESELSRRASVHGGTSPNLGADLRRTIASPLAVIRRTKFQADLAELRQYIEKHRPVALVLGQGLGCSSFSRRRGLLVEPHTPAPEVSLPANEAAEAADVPGKGAVASQEAEPPAGAAAKEITQTKAETK